MQLDPADPLLRLSAKIPWQEFEGEFAPHYKIHKGTPSKPIRLIVGFQATGKLRSCLETPVLCQAPQHNAGHCDVNPGFVRPSKTLVAFAKPA